MELLCIQSQEHPKLPLAELNAVIECENLKTTVEVITEGLVILKDIDDEVFDEYYRILINRLGYTHEVLEVIKKSSVEDLNDDISSIDWSNYINKTFAVRVKKFKDYHNGDEGTPISTVGSERKAGSLILAN
ncbi:MAG: TIGR01177 family methyltransferase, partial [Methanobrevibacter sp.]|nr:TIGR01177 family methyltransferase [Methanobrevibacter sp.]